MKAVILAGGAGTRLAEETHIKPKPMVEIGGHPILWHIMKLYAHYNIREFYIALGYKGEVIKHYFLDYRALNGSFRIELNSGQVELYSTEAEDWDVHLMDTGAESGTGGRILRLKEHLQDGPFMVTYGDGVGNIDLDALQRQHRKMGELATVTAVRPPARFGGLEFDGERVKEFTEKPQAGEGWINGGFFILEPEIFSYLSEDRDSLEVNLLERLAAEGKLAAYNHYGFWQCMDTLRDKRLLERLWNKGDAPWKVWS